MHNMICRAVDSITCRFRGRVGVSRTCGFAAALAGVMVAAAAHAVTPEKYYDYVQSTKDIYVANA